MDDRGKAREKRRQRKKEEKKPDGPPEQIPHSVAGALVDAEVRIQEEVTTVLTGTRLRNLGKTSFYSPSFVESIKSGIKATNETFATAIETPNAELSAKQIEFALEYPANAPADGKLLCNGVAGSSKSTCLGTYMSFQHLGCGRPPRWIP